MSKVVQAINQFLPFQPSTKTISNKLGDKVTTIGGACQQLWKKMTINRPQSGAQSKIFPQGVKMIVRKVVDVPKTTQEKLNSKFNSSNLLLS